MLCNGWYCMGKGSEKSGWGEAAFGALVADGCFCLAFTVSLLSRSTMVATVGDYLAMAMIFAVLVAACWAIHYEHSREEDSAETVVKRLRVRELKEGAAIEFDGESYLVDTINRSRGHILISRVGQPGRIVVEIEGRD